MKFKYSYIILLVCTVLFFQCKKKKDPEPTTPPTIYTNVCTGNGGTKYVPLTVGNFWTYTASTLLGNLPVTTTITKDTVAFGKTYYVVTTSQNILPKGYQRYNASGDLVGLDSLSYGKSTEALLVPASPIVNQVFATNSQGSSKVISTNASLPINAAGCTYTGLLQIDVAVTGGNTTTFYYKKGIGLVHLDCSAGAGSCSFSSAYLSAMSIY